MNIISSKAYFYYKISKTYQNTNLLSMTWATDQYAGHICTTIWDALHTYNPYYHKIWSEKIWAQVSFFSE